MTVPKGGPRSRARVDIGDRMPTLIRLQGPAGDVTTGFRGLVGKWAWRSCGCRLGIKSAAQIVASKAECVGQGEE